MQAVVLCAGKGSRLRPLTDATPKPLVKINGRTILSSALDGLLSEGVRDITFVVKYRANQIQDYVIANYSGNFTFVEQGETGGTGAAILAAKHNVTREFIMLFGDSVFTSTAVRDIRNGAGHGVVGVVQSHEPERYGCVELQSNGFVSRITEKPDVAKSKLVVLGGYRFPPSIMNYLERVPLSGRGELEAPDAVNLSIDDGCLYGVADISGSHDIASLDDIVRLDPSFRLLASCAFMPSIATSSDPR
ncbi:sugar phosphate nucleotidyltransferase [Pseudoruegeria sp. SK021]|uniref:sugar phosphate nucleotidyltransferase n=1 Tax=Pseudoruegeria sp. SK021 TaxID=1933035 RepID=UPI000A2641F1|nr:sugar phosphate nucleotidyltransferase [Pseudoruegeria sp. SK021]OSP53871.1 hypothetical protein BV911_15710 [Pseudoruegeria sp. SK021]